MAAATHRPPASCPTCQGALTLTGLACDSCGTEVRGRFHRCEFCALDDDQRALLRVFLATRGNVKEIERYLGVSYPTARARLDDLIRAVGVSGQHAAGEARGPAEGDAAIDRQALLAEVAAGRVDVGTALAMLTGGPSGS